jgi:hypothetical protein
MASVYNLLGKIEKIKTEGIDIKQLTLYKPNLL